MEILVSKRAEKDLKKIPSKDLSKIKKKISLLQKESSCGKKLKGDLNELYSLRTWPYRIVYQIAPRKIYIVHIMHRQEGYGKI